MVTIIKMTFSQFLTDKYLEWQKESGERKTAAEFAAWLGFPKTTLSSWWNHKITPKDGDTIRKLASKLGVEIYDILKLPRPDEDLAYISQHWDVVSPEYRQKFRSNLRSAHGR
jgi:hypothetical protein